MEQTGSGCLSSARRKSALLGRYFERAKKDVHLTDNTKIRLPRHRLPTWKRLLRRAAKKALALRYRNFSPDSEPDRTTTVAGLRLRVLRGVFNPSMHFTSAVFARYLMKSGAVLPGSSVLDLGTGTGVLAIAAAKSGAARVVATDVNPQAVRCAALNVQRQGLGGTISVREGDMFGAVQGDKFDLVLCNPPYFRGDPRTMAERAFYAGRDLDWIQAFARDLHGRINAGGSAIISLGDAADLESLLDLLAGQGWRCVEVERHDSPVESVYLFRLSEAGPD